MALDTDWIDSPAATGVNLSALNGLTTIAFDTFGWACVSKVCGGWTAAADFTCICMVDVVDEYSWTWFGIDASSSVVTVYASSVEDSADSGVVV